MSVRVRCLCIVHRLGSYNVYIGIPYIPYTVNFVVWYSIALRTIEVIQMEIDQSERDNMRWGQERDRR